MSPPAAATDWRWASHRKNKRAGRVRRLADGRWEGENARGRFIAATEREAELAVAKAPMEPPPRPPRERILPVSHFALTAIDAGFIVHNEKGREIGGALPTADKGFAAFALGQPIGRFATPEDACRAIKSAALRIQHEHRNSRPAVHTAGRDDDPCRAMTPRAGFEPKDA